MQNPGLSLKPHPHQATCGTMFIPTSGETKLTGVVHQYNLLFSTIMDEKTAQLADLDCALPSDVECDVCTGRKRKAQQSCLECLASFCENHIDLHNILHVEKRHKLVLATRSLKESICPKHDKLMEIFCRKDQQCICHLCTTNKHKNHDVVLIKDEVPEKKV